MKWLRDLSLKWKLTLVILLSALTALLLTCVALVFHDVITFREAMAQELTVLADTLGRNSTAALSFPDEGKATAKEVLSSLKAQPHVIDAIIYSADGSRFADYVRDGAHPNFPAKPPADGYQFASHLLVLANPITLEGKRIGTIYMQADQERLYNRIRSFLLIVAIVMLAAIIVTFVLSFFLQRLITRPILALTNTARTIAHSKDYSLRAKKVGQDEIGVLTESINQMLAEIQSGQRALAKTSEELAKVSISRLKLAVESVHMGVWDLDLVTDSAWRSELHDRVFGYPAMLDRWGHDVFMKHVLPDDRELVTRRFKEAFDTGQLSVECRIVWPDASIHWIESKGRVYRDDSSKPVRMMGMVIDVTSRKLIDEQLQEKNRLLEAAIDSERNARESLMEAQGRLVQSEKLAALGQLVAGVAHEINNPLAFVMNNVAVMKRDVAQFNELLSLYQSGDAVLVEHHPDLHQRIEAFARRIDLPCTIAELDSLIGRSREGLVRIQQIVKDLRDFARQEAVGDVQDAADLNVGIESTLNIARGQAIKHDIKFEKDLAPLQPVTCRPAKINQVILNLVMNAIDACGEHGKITVRSRNVANGVEIQVIDDGMGIEPLIRDKIFDPFFTTKPQGKGTGLGLSISHGIVTEHGGQIKVESELGHGSHFTVVLPLSPPHKTEDARLVQAKSN